MLSVAADVETTFVNGRSVQAPLRTALCPAVALHQPAAASAYV